MPKYTAGQPRPAQPDPDETGFEDTIERAAPVLRVVKTPESPAPAGTIRPKAVSIMSLKRREPDDPSILVGNAWLCRGAGALFVAPTGVGKSTFSLQMAMHFVLGR